MLVTGLIWQRKNNPEVSFPEQNIIRLATISIGCKQTLWLKGGLAHQGCCWTTRGLSSFSPWTEASPFWPLSRQSLPRTKKNRHRTKVSENRRFSCCFPPSAQNRTPRTCCYGGAGRTSSKERQPQEPIRELLWAHAGTEVVGGCRPKNCCITLMWALV